MKCKDCQKYGNCKSGSGLRGPVASFARGGIDMIYRIFFDCRRLPPDMPEERRIQIARDAAARDIAESIRDKIKLEHDPRTNTVRGTLEL